MAIARILVVDDDEIVRLTLAEILKLNGFEVTTASTVSEALTQITTHQFDALLTDLHMPAAGDGLTVVSAMRHANPQAVTMLLSSYPAMGQAANAIMLQADEVLVKPTDVTALVDTIRQRLAAGPHRARPIESVAAILERSSQSTIDDWYTRIQADPAIMAIPLSREQRCAHLPQFFRDLIHRLGAGKQFGARGLRQGTALNGRRAARNPAPLPGLHRRHDRGRVARAADQHLPDPAEQPHQPRLQRPPRRRHDHRRRDRIAARPGHAMLRRRIPRKHAGHRLIVEVPG